MLGLLVEPIDDKRRKRIEALQGALSLLAEAGLVVAGDVYLLYKSHPSSIALDNGTWDVEAEEKLAADLRSVMDRLAGIVFRLEHEPDTERRLAPAAVPKRSDSAA